jgi:NitT/TauT family transport system permease protein
MFWGFSIGVLAGTMLGVAISVNKYIYSGMSPFMEFFRSLPATALFPFFLNFFGENDASHIATAVYIALWITAFNISQAMRRIATKRKNYLGVIGAKWPFMLKHLYLYELLPALLDSCRIALSLTLLVTVAIEMIVGAKNGVGMNIFNAHYLTDYSGMTAAIIIVGFIGLALNKGAEILQARVIYWRDE